MKYPKVVLIAVLLVLAGCGKKLEFQQADGTSLDWDSLRGEWVLVNYWAEWCKPCLKEIPELNVVDGKPGVTVLGVNFDGVQGEALRQLGSKMDIRFDMLAEDPGPVLGWELPLALPATFLVNPQGELLEARFGPQTEAELLELMKP